MRSEVVGVFVNLKDEGPLRFHSQIKLYDLRFENSDLNRARPVNFSVELRLEAEKSWLGIEMRCAAYAAAKAQSFFSRVTGATSRLVRSKNAVRNRPDNMATQCVAAKRWSVTASSCAKSRRSSASTSSLKD